MTLARSRLAAVPGHVVVAGAGVLASAALAVAMAIMVASFRHSVDLTGWRRFCPPSCSARGAGGQQRLFRPGCAGADRRHPGVAKVDFIRHDTVLLAPDRPAVVLIADRSPPMVANCRWWAAGGDRSPGVDLEAVADLYGYGAGDTIGLPLAGEAARVLVAGVWRDYASERRDHDPAGALPHALRRSARQRCGASPAARQAPAPSLRGCASTLAARRWSCPGG